MSALCLIRRPQFSMIGCFAATAWAAVVTSSVHCAQPPAKNSNAAEWIAKFHAADPMVRYQAVEALGKMGEAAVPALRKAFAGPTASIRWYAGAALQRLGLKAISALPEVNAGLASPDEFTRLSSLAIMASLGDAAKNSVPKLLKLSTTDASPRVRRKAVEAIGGMGAAGKSAVPQLLKMLHDDDPAMRLAAVTAIGNLGADAGNATPHLLKALAKADWRARRRIVAALGRMGKSAGPHLLKALNNKDAKIRREVVSVLSRVGMSKSELIPVFTRSLKDADSQVRRNAATALGSLGKEGVKPLLTALNDKDSGVRQSAATALGRMKSSAKHIVPKLIVALDDQSRFVRNAAATALAGFGKDARAAIPHLIKLINSKDAFARRNAVQTLAKIAPIKGDARTFDAKLTDKDSFDKIRAQHRCKVHFVNLAAGKIYCVDMTSKDFDTWIRLESPKGVRLQSDDDSGDGLNSRIVFAPKADGRYRIITTTYARGKTGAYQLRIAEMDVSAK